MKLISGWLATVWGIFVANKNNIPVHVWVDETRPRNQGFSLTAWELLNENIKNSLIVDNVGGHLMQHNKIEVSLALIELHLMVMSAIKLEHTLKLLQPLIIIFLFMYQHLSPALTLRLKMAIIEE